jgi:hypothetical protein
MKVVKKIVHEKKTRPTFFFQRRSMCPLKKTIKKLFENYSTFQLIQLNGVLLTTSLLQNVFTHFNLTS